MTDERAQELYVARLTRLPLIGPDGYAVGKVDDVVLAPSGPNDPPRVLGFVANVQRRHIFVNAGRIAEIESSAVRLATGTLDLRRFHQRPGEMLAKRDLLDRRVGGEVVNDVAIVQSPSRFRGWEVSRVALSAAGLLRRRAGRTVEWREVPSLFDVGPVARSVVALRELHPADAASTFARLPAERRHELAEAMHDEELADVLEELPEDEQRAILEGMDVERVADILHEMDPDDAADLLGGMADAERDEILEYMPAADARPLRRLLAYDEKTAGGLMTPEPLVVGADVTVAEALARMRDPDLPAAIAAQVFVVEPPYETPTGAYLGELGFQRLLREPPYAKVGGCLTASNAAITPDADDVEVAHRLAAYDTVAVAVVDSAGRLLGAVTVDDVLDHVLPEDWRRRRTVQVPSRPSRSPAT